MLPKEDAKRQFKSEKTEKIQYEAQSKTKRKKLIIRQGETKEAM